MWQKFRAYFLQILLSLGISTFLVLVLLPNASLQSNQWLQRLDYLLYDLEMRLAQAPPSSTELVSTPKQPKVVLIDIDEASLSKASHKSWPWNQETMAEIINNLARYKPKTIVLNQHFTRAQAHPFDAMENFYEDKFTYSDTDFKALDGNLKLEQAIRRNSVILGFLFHEKKSDINFLPKAPAIPYKNIAKHTDFLGYSTNYTQIDADHQGFTNALTDEDGIVRSAPLFLPFIQDSNLYPSIALIAARRFFKEPVLEPLLANDQSSAVIQNYLPKFEISDQQYIQAGVVLNQQWVRTDPYGQILLPFKKNQIHIETLSAHFFLNSPTKEKPALDTKNLWLLKDSVVFIGSSLKQVGDTVTSPIHKQLSNMELQAHTFLALINPEELLYRPVWTNLALTIQIVAFTIVMLLLYPLLKPMWLVISGALLIVTSIGIHWSLMNSLFAYVSPMTPILLILSITLIFLLSNLFRESKHRAYLQSIFGQYVPPEHIHYMMQNMKQQIEFTDDRREMSVMFADLHQFTELAESFNIIELKQFLNDYLTPATDIIFEHNGTIDKYIGDLIMAFWGAPVQDEQHAQNAVLAALGLQNMLQNFEAYGLGDHPIRLGIGINTGLMSVGDMGSQHRRSFTVMGDAVNIASRIESLTRYYDVDILVSYETMIVCPSVIFRTVDKVIVKGKKKSVRLYQPLGTAQTLIDKEIKHKNLHEAALKAYWSQEWEVASQLFAKSLVMQANDPLAKLYLNRIKQFREQDLPQYWDGVHVHQHK